MEASAAITGQPEKPMPLLEALRALVGASHVLSEPEQIHPYLIEERGLYTGTALAVVQPGTTREVAAIVRLCAERSLPIVPQGGNTGVVGGGVPQEAVVISTRRLNRVRQTDPLNGTITVEAGCILADIQNAAEQAGKLFPLSLGSEGSCQIGGNISTNAGGNAVLRYGNMRELVMGLEVVLPDGEILNDLYGLRKNNTGYDLRDLFIGAEGTLGIVTAAVLKLFPMPVRRATTFMACANAHKALAFFKRLREAHGEQLSTFEFMEREPLQIVLDHAPGTMDPMERPYPAYSLIELTSSDPEADLETALENILAAAFEADEILDAVIPASMGQGRALHALREHVSDAQKQAGASIKHDVSVPVSRVADFIEAAKAACHAHMKPCRVVAFGHFGDGNIHFNLAQPKGMEREAFMAHYPAINRIVHDIVHAMSGSISAEHGIGHIKRHELARYKDPVALRLMHRIKSVIDPQNIMNPGKVLLPDTTG